MEQSRENYESLHQDVEMSYRMDKEKPTNLDELMSQFDRALLRFTHGQHQSEYRLQAYLKEGHAEANELNKEYDRLKQAVDQTKHDLDEYAGAHSDVVDETTPGFQQLRDRVEQSVDDFQTFQQEKLGITTEDAAEVA